MTNLLQRIMGNIIQTRTQSRHRCVFGVRVWYLSTDFKMAEPMKKRTKRVLDQAEKDLDQALTVTETVRHSIAGRKKSKYSYRSRFTSAALAPSISGSSDGCSVVVVSSVAVWSSHLSINRMGFYFFQSKCVVIVPSSCDFPTGRGL